MARWGGRSVVAQLMVFPCEESSVFIRPSAALWVSKFQEPNWFQPRCLQRHVHQNEPSFMMSNGCTVQRTQSQARHMIPSTAGISFQSIVLPLARSHLPQMASKERDTPRVDLAGTTSRRFAVGDDPLTAATRFIPLIIHLYTQYDGPVDLLHRANDRHPRDDSRRRTHMCAHSHPHTNITRKTQHKRTHIHTATSRHLHTSTRKHTHYITLHYITLHYITLHYITLHYITLHYITLHYITLHYITLHYITLHYITLHYITLHYITLHYITLHYITLHYITLHYITLHYITLHYITLHYITLHYITLHYITLHYITLHYITLHYITLHYITLHYITLHYITLHYITLHYITLHYITLHYITLHYITLHYITLHYITLHYITLHYITSD